MSYGALKHLSGSKYTSFILYFQQLIWVERRVLWQENLHGGDKALNDATHNGVVDHNKATGGGDFVEDGPDRVAMMDDNFTKRLKVGREFSGGVRVEIQKDGFGTHESGC
ncbi:hypothetical protein L6452_42400 [Arctium lappa]|uniref:Uncharacterized protein n=1 Tax=Arctium lappa TaxID=4217 RepID=A0ACB8XIJ7_ARCLA|nr:hypothetical protein L6452_42400 [Arctium lappa]